MLQQDYLSYTFATARDNITYGKVTREFDQESFDRAIDKAEARDVLAKLPKGVDSYVSPWMAHNDGTNGVDLSGGQWQRLALARNFYRQAPIDHPRRADVRDRRARRVQDLQPPVRRHQPDPDHHQPPVDHR